MGLMYIMPVSEKEVDRVEISSDENKSITLKSYGLPLIFWGYLAAIVVVILAMGLAIKNPMLKMMEMSDPINQLLAWIVLSTLLAIPLSLIGFLFYEKFISKSGEELTITHRLFWIPVFKKRYLLKDSKSFQVQHYLSSPNQAKIDGNQDHRAFQNQGYYNLIGILKNDQTVLIDRHSRKADLTKISEVLTKF